MWVPDQAKLIKIRIHSQGEDPETPWAEDCGPAPGEAGARFARLGNVPFLHAKPTYGDVIVVRPDEDGMLAWDSEGLPYERLCDRLIEDSGRWAMILDYELLNPDGDAQQALGALDRAGEKRDIAVEGCFGPKLGKPGRAYLAIPSGLEVEDVLKYLEDQRLPMRLTLVHPRDDEDEAE